MILRRCRDGYQLTLISQVTLSIIMTIYTSPADVGHTIEHSSGDVTFSLSQHFKLPGISTLSRPPKGDRGLKIHQEIAPYIPAIWSGESTQNAHGKIPKIYKCFIQQDANETGEGRKEEKKDGGVHGICAGLILVMRAKSPLLLQFVVLSLISINIFFQGLLRPHLPELFFSLWADGSSSWWL